MALYFFALFIKEMSQSSSNDLFFMLQLASGESIFKQKFKVNYFQMLLYVEPFQATHSHCVLLQN